MMLRAASYYTQTLGLRLVTQSPSKVPFRCCFRRGSDSATTDMDRMERALRHDADAMLAARVGRHIVLDVDVRRDGLAQLRRLPPLPRTWMAETPSGGRHIWFRHPKIRVRGKLAKGIEVLRAGHLVTLPPSRRSGGEYRWLVAPWETSLAELPQWVLDGIAEPPEPEHVETSDIPLDLRKRRAEAFLRNQDSAISGACGHARTFTVACMVARGFDLPRDDAFDVLKEWNERCDPPWDDGDLKRKINQALTHGRRVPIGGMLSEVPR